MDYSAGSSDPVRAAVVQMSSGGDVDANLATAERLVRRAASLGAQLVVLPEKWNIVHDVARTLAAAETLDGRCVEAARAWAREAGVALVAGSIGEVVPGRDRVHNTSVAIAADGAVAGVYRKIHLFDVEVGGRVYRESDEAVAGAGRTVALVAGIPVGMTICYDLRFPELFRALTIAGARALAVPAAFTATTGRDHWEPLLRARAIENQSWVLAAGQWGLHANGTRSHGRSMIVDPWGTVVAQVSDGEGVAVADLDMGLLERVRTTLPALRHRRPDLYGD